MKIRYSFHILLSLSLLFPVISDAQVNISNGSSTACMDSLYDSGGPGSNYGTNEDFEFTISPSGADSVFLEISSSIIGVGDTIFIHDGNSSAAPNILTLHSLSVPPASLYSSNPSLTVRFVSDNLVETAGFKFIWTGVYNLNVDISTSSTSVCENESVFFDVIDSTNGGATPVFTWKINGNPVGTNLFTFDTILNNGDQVWVVMDGSPSCGLTNGPDSSSIQTITVNSIDTASVSVSTTDTNICTGDNVMFTATPTNGGATPDYQWYVNGGMVGTNSPNYSSTTLANSDFVWVEMASDISTGCLVDSLSYDSTEMVVTAITTASVALSATNTNICEGTNVTFTATPTNGGASPTYSWTVNGGAVGANSPTYMDASLGNGDNVKVTMASDFGGGCLVDSISADSTAMVVSSYDTASVSFTVTDTNICSGDNIMFTATPVNGGASPDYQWYVNAAMVGTNSPNYSSTSLADGDFVWVEMASDISTGCLVDSLSYDSTEMVVTAITTASVALSATDTTICDGTNVTFTATPTNGGASPIYSWTVNGGSVGANSPTYMDAGLNNGDIVKVTMASDFGGGCLIDSISADSTIMVVTPNSTASVSLAGDNSICNGNNVGFTATPTNGGGSPIYAWTLNGGSVGSNSSTYANSSLNDNDIVKVTMTSSFGSGCLIDSISSDSIVMNVNANPSASITGDVDVDCNGFSTGTATGAGAGGNIAVDYAYSWDDPSTQTTATAVGLVAGLYQVTITDDSLCFDTAYVTISEPTALNISFSVTDASTFGNNDGSISATASGGTPFTSSQNGYYHNWNTGVGTGYGSQRTFTYNYNSLSADWYIDTITDFNGCKYFDSAFVDQPFLLVPGEIRVNSKFTTFICDADTVGVINETAPVQGGIGNITYTWQESSNLFNWNNIPSSDTTDYLWNDTITQTRYIRRRIIDDNNDSAFSNIIVLNYVPDVTINVIGLNNNYCANEDSIFMFGSPAGNGSTTFGFFQNDVAVDSATSTFIPALASSSTIGVKNYVQYNYIDNRGCFSTLTDSTTVYTQDTGSINITQNIFTPNDAPGTLTFTYSGGSFSGTGVFFSTGQWKFDPSLVPGSSFGDTLDISFQYTNGNNCVSRDTLGVVVSDDSIRLTTDFNNDNEFYACSSDPAGKKIYAKFTPPLVVTDAQWWITNISQTNIYWDGNTYSGTFNDTVVYSINPGMMLPNVPGTLFDTTGTFNSTSVTPTGITDLTVHFRYKTVANPNWTSISRDIELVNMGTVSIFPNQNNSNGTLPGNLQYCVDLDTVTLTSSFLNLSPRPTTKAFTSTGMGLTNNGITSIIDPGAAGVGLDTILFYHTDDATGCQVLTGKRMRIDSLPVVGINNLLTSYCANDGLISFSGTTAPAGIGTFSSSSSGTLSLAQTLGTNNATIQANVSAQGNHDMKFNYTYTPTGCTDSAILNFDIHALPPVSIAIAGGFSNPNICVSDTAVLRVDGTGDATPFIGDTIFGTGIVANPSSTGTTKGTADFRPSTAGVGAHQITYVYTDANNCTDSVSDMVTVNALPSALFTTISNDYDVCLIPEDKLAFNFTGPAGTSVYTVNNNPAPIDSFLPVTNPDIQFGSNKVYHTFTETSTSCSNIDSIEIVVDPFPVVSISSPQPSYCFNGGDILFEGSPAFNGGTRSYFTSPTLGFTDSMAFVGDDSTLFSPSALNVGNHSVTYGYTHPVTGCFSDSTITIDIDTIPVLTIRVKDNPLSPFIHCKGDTVRYELLKDGVVDSSPLSYLTGPGIIDSVAQGGVLFNPDIADVDTMPGHIMTYSVTDPAVCNNADTDTIQVRETANGYFTFSPAYDTLCMQTGFGFTLTPVEPGGDFFFHGTMKAGVASATFYLDSSSVAMGGMNDSIYYTSKLTGCSNTHDTMIIVNDTPQVVNFTTLDPQYCWNEGNITMGVSPPSLGNAVVSSTTGIFPTSLLSSGDSIFSFPIDSSHVGSHSFKYQYTDANGCTSTIKDPYAPGGISITNIPSLNFTFRDSNGTFLNPIPYACATTMEVFLNGSAPQFSSNDTLGGYFTSSIFGTLNNLISNQLNGTDSVSKAIYGPVPADSFFTDTIYYHYQDQGGNGCYNRTFKTIAVKKLPPPAFTVDPSNNPITSHICPSENATTSSYYDDNVLCNDCSTKWPPAQLTRTWSVNDTGSTNNLALFDPIDPRNPSANDDIFSNYNGLNKITQRMSDNRWSLPCVSSHTEYVFLDTIPVVGLSSYVNDTTWENLICSNEGQITFKGTPVSPGGTFASSFTSSNTSNPTTFGMDDGVVIFPYTLSTASDSTVTVKMGGLQKGPVGGSRPYNLTYNYTDPNTGCSDSETRVFDLKSKPLASFAPGNVTEFCPYDDTSFVRVLVNNQAPVSNPLTLDSITGTGVDVIGGFIYGSGTAYSHFLPRLFQGDTSSTQSTVTFYHEDEDGCWDTISNSNYLVRAQPIFRLDLAGIDSVCIERARFILPIQYWDTTQNMFASYPPQTNLNGPNAPINKQYFRYDDINQPDDGPTSKFFDPGEDSKGDSAGVATKIEFIGVYANLGLCYDTLITEIVTHPKPVAQYYLDGRCSKYAPVMHGDNSSIDLVGTSTSGSTFTFNDQIVRYDWRIDGVLVTDTSIGVGDTLIDYTHYGPLSEGNHNIALRVKSMKGCRSDWVENNETFVKSPVAKFEWDMDEECEGELVTFRSTSTIPGQQPSFRWMFADDTSTAPGSTQKLFNTIGKHKVILELTEGQDCQDSITKYIYVRPNIKIADSNRYFQPFNFTDTNALHASGWTVWGQKWDSAKYSSPRFFKWGQRDDRIIYQSTDTNLAIYPYSGGHYYLDYMIEYEDSTQTDISRLIYQNLLQTSVISPCFDFTGIERPMIKLMNSQLLESNDGYVLQYTTDTGKTLIDVEWKNVGEYFIPTNTHYPTGINWYNRENIFGEPGNQNDAQGRIGWTDTSGMVSGTGSIGLIDWVESRHNIDFGLNNSTPIDSSYIRFRIAFGSNADQEQAGLAFDNFEITQRKRKVLYEMFNSAKSNDDPEIVDDYNQIVENHESDIIDIQYHTSFPSRDAFNYDNTADPSARSLYYNIGSVPFIKVDGTKFSNFITIKGFNRAVHQPLSLTDPIYRLDMTFEENTSQVTTTVHAINTPLIGGPSEVILHLAVVEQQVDKNSLSEAQRENIGSNYTEFRNVLKKMYPSASGTLLKPGGYDGWEYTSTHTIAFENFYENAEDYKIIAFVQDKNTRVVYQAEWLDAGKMFTDAPEYSDLVDGGVEYVLFPNPTNGTTYMKFLSELKGNYQMRIFNEIGVLVRQENIPEGTGQFGFDMHDMKPGMYFIMLNNGEQEVAIKKLIVGH